jgi:NitT/TauT family transport system permease protein
MATELPLAGVAPPTAAPRGRSVLAKAWQKASPVLGVALALLVLWYAGAVALNAPRVTEQLDGLGARWGARELVLAAWSMERPVLPAPHQIAQSFWQGVFEAAPDSPRSLLFHAGVTLSATVLGFALGMVLGVLLAIGVVHSRVLDRGLLPWIIASQTIPILAIAPMVVVVLGSLGLPPLASKAVISMYLCFFPVAVGMVKGLRSPELLQLDLLHTYLFASAKVAITASLVGAIVGELPTGAQAGLGARLLSGSYFGQTTQIWSALLMASLLGVLLVAAVSLAQQLVGRVMGARA